MKLLISDNGQMTTLLACWLLIVSHLASAVPAPEPHSPYIKSHNNRVIAPPSPRMSRRQTVARGVDSGCYAPAPAISAPKTNVWGGLTDPKAASVVAWLFGQPDLNLTTSDKAGEWDNSITLVELMIPNKTDVVSYLDNGGAPPARYAHVLLDMSATEDASYADILVGPLPIQANITTWQPLEWPYTRKTGGKVRNRDASSASINTELVYGISASIQDITIDLWNGTALGLDNDTLGIWPSDPGLQEEDGRILNWHGFMHLNTTIFDTASVTPTGLYFLCDETGRDPSKWSLLGWFYNNVYYQSTEEFRAAYYSPGFPKLPANIDGDWSNPEHAGPVLPKDTQTPPQMVAPGGSRYSLDAEQKYVEWMDFSFYIGFSRDTGMALYDIKYKGERVLYELGLQEALAHYAGADPVQSNVAYLDSYYGFGPYAFELVQGYDCPTYATYLNSSFYISETTHTHVNSICMFEYVADHPIQRHSSDQHVTVTKNTYFNVRSVSTVGNYDYMFTYSFYLDGSMAVEVRASGYIQAAYYANNQDYGFHIHDFLSGSMHDHVLNFKADFDILGTKNSIQLMSNVPTTEVYPWSQGKGRNTMKLKREYVQSEDSSRLNWAANGETQVLVLNQDQTNKYGEKRGYRILPSAGTAHLTIKDSSVAVNSANWAGYDLQFTRQHDYEPRSAHPYNVQDIHNPPINFDKFFNGESLVQEDVVAWINLGMHHVPHTGDLPNTVFTTAHSAVQFMPTNYLLGDASRQTINMVTIDYMNGVVSDVETFGQKNNTCTITPEAVDANLWSYIGDVVVRKFPYDPEHPYDATTSIE